MADCPLCGAPNHTCLNPESWEARNPPMTLVKTTTAGGQTVMSELVTTERVYGPNEQGQTVLLYAEGAAISEAEAKRLGIAAAPTQAPAERRAELAQVRRDQYEEERAKDPGVDAPIPGTVDHGVARASATAGLTHGALGQSAQIGTGDIGPDAAPRDADAAMADAEAAAAATGGKAVDPRTTKKVAAPAKTKAKAKDAADPEAGGESSGAPVGEPKTPSDADAGKR